MKVTKDSDEKPNCFPYYQSALCVICLCAILVRLTMSLYVSQKTNWLISMGCFGGAVYFALAAFIKYCRFDCFGRGEGERKTNQFKETYSKKSRKSITDANAVAVTMAYYDMVTDWFESCWAQSFQLGSAQGFYGEGFSERCRRHDYWFAHLLGIKKGERWLDIGCGVGGPLRNILRITEANITGVNLNAYQLERAQKHLIAEDLGGLASFVACDMAKLSEKFEPSSVNGVYALEAVCHCTNKEMCYKEFFDVLKPGGIFGCSEWVLTDLYDDSNPVHRECRHAIEVFGGVALLETSSAVLDKIRSVGFEILEQEDLSLRTVTFPDPWYDKFEAGWAPLKWPISKPGVACLQAVLRVSEFFGLVPKGTAITHMRITSGIPGTALSGKLGIFTPQFFIKARKPFPASTQN